MSKLLWDLLGDRFYETGIDRGVLYLSDGRGVAWSGLTGVEEDFGGDGSEARYFDGVKYLDEPINGTFQGTLRAFTYPEEFLEYEGLKSLGNGLFVDDQTPTTFGLSYRTLVGNDVAGSDRGYKIHLLYNVLASPESTNNQTQGDSANLNEFSWRLSATPAIVDGYRPTAHVWFDSRYLEGSGLLEGIQDLLYGTETTDPRLPSISELIEFTAGWDPRVIIPDSFGGLAVLQSGLGDLTPSATVAGLYVPLANGRLASSTPDGFYQLP